MKFLAHAEPYAKALLCSHQLPSFVLARSMKIMLDNIVDYISFKYP